MKRILLGLIFIGLTSVAFAQRPVVEVDGLTEAQRAEIQLDIAKRKERNKETQRRKEEATTTQNAAQMLQSVPEAPKSEKLDAWVQVGVNLGKGLAAVAKEVGVAVNDFVKTPVGQIATAVIIYKLMGKELIKLSVGSLFMLTFGLTWLYLFRRICMLDRIIVSEDMKDGTNGKKVKVKRKEVIYGDKWKNTDGATAFMFFVTGIAIPTVGLFVMLG